jgi:hypothetical protein
VPPDPATATVLIARSGANTPTTVPEKQFAATALPAHTLTTATSPFVTQDQFNTGLSVLSNSLRELVFQNISAPGSLPATGGYTNSIALTNRIDNLANVTISNSTIDTPTITGGSISGSSISAINLSGGSLSLTAALPISSGGTGTTTAAGAAIGIGLPDYYAVNSGTKCDGVTNDTSSINSALGHVGNVILPAGTCVVSGPINVPSNTFLHGSGIGVTTIKTPANPGYPAVKFAQTVSNAGVSDLSINGNSSVAGTRESDGVFAVDGSSQIKVYRVEVYGTADNGIEVDGSKSEVAFSYVHNNYTNGIYSIGTGGTGARSQYNWIHNNDVENNSVGTKSWDGIDVDPNTAYSTIESNLVVGNDIILFETGATVPTSYGHAIINNTITNSIENGIDLSGYLTDIVVSGNRIFNASGSGIFLNSPINNLKLQNNYINGTNFGTYSHTEGILIDNASYTGNPNNIEIDGNTIKDVGTISGTGPAILIKNSATNYHVRNNTVTDDRSPVLLTYAADVSAASSIGDFEFNSFIAGTSGTIRAGSNSPAIITATSTGSAKIGIGTDSPTAALDILRSGTATVDAVIRNASVALKAFVDAGAAYIGTNTNSPFLMITNGLERARFDTLGNFGIGTTSPATNLAVAGNAYNTGGLGVGVLNTSVGTIQSSGNILGGGTLALSGTTGTSTIASGQGFTIGGSQLVLQQGSGRVGIGTNAPSTLLDIFNSGSATADLTIRNGTVAGKAFVDSGAMYLGTNTNHPLIFQTNGAQVARFDTSGHFGIGTTSPFANLSVVGNGYVSSAFSLGTNPATSGLLNLPNNTAIAARNAANTADLSLFKLDANNINRVGTPLSFDDSSDGYINRNAALMLRRDVASPTGVQATSYFLTTGKGDNSTFIGVSGGYFRSADRTDVDATNKGVLYGLQLSVAPRVSRNNVPADDATGLVVQNDTSNVSKATDAIYVGHNSAFTGTTPEWITSFLTDANTDTAYRASGNYGYGFDLCWSSGCAGISNAALRVPNNATIVSRNAAGNADISLTRLTALNFVEIANGKFTIDTNTGTATTSGTILPIADGTLNLGKTADRFSSLFAKAWSTDDGSQNWTLTSSGNTDFTFTRSGSEKLRITSAGNIGVGTSSPATTLSTAGNEYMTGGLGVGLLNTAAGTLQTSGNGTLGGVLALNGTTGTTTIASGQGFAIGTSQLVLQQNSGRVGIGTASPSDMLTVAGAIGITSDRFGNIGAGGRRFNNVYANLFTTDDGSNNWTLTSPNSNADFTFARNGSEKLRITSGGNIGIGSSTPASLLSVAGDTYLTGGLGVGLQNTSAGTLLTSGNGTFGGLLAINGTTGTTTIASGQGFAIGGTQFALIGSNGHIGINANPSASDQVTINGSIVPTGDANGSRLGLSGKRWSSVSAQGFNTDDGSNNWTLSTPNANADFTFARNGSEKLRVTSGGNVGIGTTTPTASLSVAGNFVPGTLTQAGLLSEAVPTITSNAGSNPGVPGIIFNDSGQSVSTLSGGIFSSYFGTNVAGGLVDGMTFISPRDLDGGYSGAVNWGFRFNSQSGSTRMFIDTASGNVGIGTTTPYSRLTVWGPDSAASTTAFLVANNASTTEFAVLDNGNATLAGNLIQNSDQRLKTNIQSLDASSSISAINALNPVSFSWIDSEKSGVPQYGFIAQDVQKILPNLVSITSPTTLTPDGTLSLNYNGFIAPLVAAVQNLIDRMNDFADHFTTKELTFTRAIGDEVDAKKLCLQKSDGTSVCVTGDQLAAALGGTTSGEGSSVTAPPDTTPPTIAINGSYLAHLHVGDSYADLGASVTDNVDKNLGYKTFLNGALVSDILIDTSAVATDTIDYVAVDQAGNTATSTRTVVIEASSITP